MTTIYNKTAVKESVDIVLGLIEKSEQRLALDIVDTSLLEKHGEYLMRAAAYYEGYALRRGLEKMGASTFMLAQYLERKDKVQITVKKGLVLQTAAIIKRNI